MNETERQQSRLPAQSRVFIELEAPAAGSSEDASIAVCRTLDVSSHGLQVALEHELIAEAYLQIGIEPPEGEGEPFFLTGQVRWCRPGEAPEHSWLAGFELLPADHSDLARWVALISDIS